MEKERERYTGEEEELNVSEFGPACLFFLCVCVVVVVTTAMSDL